MLAKQPQVPQSQDSNPGRPWTTAIPQAHSVAGTQGQREWDTEPSTGKEACPVPGNKNSPGCLGQPGEAWNEHRDPEEPGLVRKRETWPARDSHLVSLPAFDSHLHLPWTFLHSLDKPPLEPYYLPGPEVGPGHHRAPLTITCPLPITATQKVPTKATWPEGPAGCP